MHDGDGHERHEHVQVGEPVDNERREALGITSARVVPEVLNAQNVAHAAGREHSEVERRRERDERLLRGVIDAARPQDHVPAHRFEPQRHDVEHERGREGRGRDGREELKELPGPIEPRDEQREDHGAEQPERPADDELATRRRGHTHRRAPTQSSAKSQRTSA